MPRLDTERQNKLEPERMDYAIKQIAKIIKTDIYSNATRIEFEWKEESVFFFPYSGWATGKSIKDGRGLQKLLTQLKIKTNG